MDYLSIFETFTTQTVFSFAIATFIAYIISKNYVDNHLIKYKINVLDHMMHDLLECMSTLKANNDSSDDSSIDSLSEVSAEDEENNEDGEVDDSQVIDFINTATTEQIEMILEACCNTEKVLIPNWFTKSDFEHLTDITLTDSKWKKLNHKSNELIGHTNAMLVQWFDNVVQGYNNNEVFFEDSEDGEEENESSDETSQNILLDNDDSDEESTKESIENQLYGLKYKQLLKLAVSNNKSLTKSDLVSKIMNNNSTKNVKKSLSKFL